MPGDRDSRAPLQPLASSDGGVSVPPMTSACRLAPDGHQGVSLRVSLHPGWLRPARRRFFFCGYFCRLWPDVARDDRALVVGLLGGGGPAWAWDGPPYRMDRPYPLYFLIPVQKICMS